MRDPDEQQLYLWVRVFGAILFFVTLSLTVIALVFFDRDIDSGTVVVIFGTLTTSALALVGVQVSLRRGNGRGGED